VLTYTTDRYGSTNGEQILLRASDFGFTAQSLVVATLPPSFSALPDRDLDTLEQQILRKILTSRLRVVIHVSLLEDSESFFRMVKRGGMLGPGWLYLGADAWANWATGDKLRDLESGAAGFSRVDLLGTLLVVADESQTPVTERFQKRYQELYNTTEMEPFIFAGYDCVRAIGMAVIELLTQTALDPAELGTATLESGVQEQLADAAMSLEFEGAGGFVQFAKPGSANAGDRVPRYSILNWVKADGGPTWIQKATFDENRPKPFLEIASFEFSNGQSSFDAFAPSCPVGTEPNPNVTAGEAGGPACRTCSPGRYKPTTTDSPCTECQAGFACPAGSVTMTACGPGTYSPPGQSECQPCPAGTASSAPAVEECGRCPPGFVQEKLGQQQCDPCGTGSYQANAGKTSCLACNSTFSTENPGAISPELCGCPVGTYLVAEERRCKPCTEGVSCTLFDMPPLVAEHFYMPTGAPRDVSKLDVYECATARECPGQSSHGDPVCAFGYRGTNCAKCEDNYFPDGLQCSSCGTLGKWFLLLAFLVVLVVAGPLHWRFNHGGAEKNNDINEISFSTTVSVGLAYVQTLGVIGAMSLQWPDAFAELIDLATSVGQGSLLTLLFFDIRVLRPACSIKQTLAAAYTTRLMLPVVFVVVFAVWFFASFCVHRMWKRFPVFRVEDLCHSVGSILIGLYISVVSACMLLLDCRTSPNDKKVVRTIPFAECSGPEYEAMIPVFVLAALVYIPGIAGLVCYALFVAPSKYTSPRFRVMIHFLVSDFRPDVWWFKTIHLVHALLLGMVTVVWPDGVHAQWLAFLSIFLTSLVVHQAMLPYSEHHANVLETWVFVVLIVVTICGGLFLEPLELSSVPKRVGQGLLVVVTLGMVGVAVGFLNVLRHQRSKAEKLQRREQEMKSVVEDFIQIANLMSWSHEPVVELLLGYNYVDLRNLTSSLRLFRLELCGHQPARAVERRLSAGRSKLSLTASAELTSRRGERCDSWLDDNYASSEVGGAVQPVIPPRPEDAAALTATPQPETAASECDTDVCSV